MTAALRRSVTLLAGLWLAGCARDSGPPLPVPAAEPDLLMITLDTFRADRAGCYGNPDGWTPYLDRVLRTAWQARNAYTPAPLTAIAHATLLTGLLPYHHGVRDNGWFPLDPGIPTLASHLAAAGFSTAAFVAAFPLTTRFGFAHGFQHFDEDLGGAGEGGLEYAERPAHEVVDRALRYIAGMRAGTRCFIWTHFFDPHFPYHPPAPFGRLPLATDYEREIRAMDSQIGRLLRGVEGTGRRTVTLVVSDHGEGLRDHGEVTHGILVHEEMMRGFLGIRVPAAPGRDGRWSGVWDPVVPYADILPTTLDALGVAALDGIDGRSVLAGGTTGGAYGETYYPALHYRWSPLLSWRDDAWAYLDGPVPELYDRRGDPGESRDVSREHPDIVEDRRARLAAVARVPDEPQSSLDDAAREKLEALGYVGRAQSLEFDPAKNPKDFLGAMQDLFHGMSLAADGRVREALAPLQRAYRADPGNGSVCFQLADCLRRTGSVETAMDYYRKAIDADPRIDQAWAHLALLRFERGRREEAFHLLDEGRRHNPESFALWMTTGDLHAETGAADDARKDYETVATLYPAHREPWDALARLAAARGDREEARRLAERAATADAPGDRR